MIPVYICDDEKNVLEKITAIVESQIMIEALDMGPVFASTKQAELLVVPTLGNTQGVYFLDVDFVDDEDGFQLAKKIREKDPRGYIVFITAHSERSVETFHYRLEAMDYIVKGDEAEITRRIKECLHIVEQRLSNENNGQKKFYTCKIFDIIRHIPIDEILYFEADGQSHRIYLYTEKETLDFLGSLKSIEEELGDDFFRSHRSYLVNRDKIHSIHLKENTVELVNGSTCLLSRNAKKSFV